jgi:cell fate (sporulation/competence/biofilm development) regulator YlbF (YheA/YmcA/DUF963 family)
MEIKILICEPSDSLFLRWKNEVSQLYRGSLVIERNLTIAQCRQTLEQERIDLIVLNFSALGREENAENNLKEFKLFLKEKSANTQLILISKNRQIEEDGQIAKSRSFEGLQGLISDAVKREVATLTSAFQPERNYSRDESKATKSRVRDLAEEIDRLEEVLFGCYQEKGLVVKIELLEEKFNKIEDFTKSNKKKINEIEDFKNKLQLLYEVVAWIKNNPALLLLITALVTGLINYLNKR